MNGWSMYEWADVEYYDDNAGRILRTQVCAIAGGWLFRTMYEISGATAQSAAAGVGVGMTFVPDPSHANQPQQLNNPK